MSFSPSLGFRWYAVVIGHADAAFDVGDSVTLVDAGIMSESILRECAITVHDATLFA